MAEKCSDFVDVFWGSKIFVRQTSGKLTNKWFFFKPQTGNLAPTCCLPNSAFCVVPYSGGYPTGYGIYNPCSASVPTKMAEENFLRGFTHFSQSGTGFIENFYNYFMICPSKDKQKIVEERGGCGWYEVVTPAFGAKVAMDGSSANYSFEVKDKAIYILPYFGGLDNSRCKPKKYAYTAERRGQALVFCMDIGGMPLYFAVDSKDKFSVAVDNGAYRLAFETERISLSLSYSFYSADEAYERLQKSSFSYKEARAKAENIWEKALSTVKIEGAEREKKLFYTALYNALKKPCFDVRFETAAFDYATLWDMYKTQLPLLYLLYPDIATKAVDGLGKLFNGGRFDNLKLMEPGFRASQQAVCLASIAIAMAYKCGVKADYDTLLPLAARDVEYQARAKKLFKPHVTHNLDYIDAYCALTDCGVKLSAEAKAAVVYRNSKLYGKDGLLKTGFRRKFYEGTYKNYSFRVSSGTDLRLEACDKNGLKAELDKFFGFDGADVKWFTESTPDAVLNKYGNKVCRFEGLNNEPDMETMYTYHLLKDYGKCEDILNEVMEHQFNLTNGGLCGNDDSGGLTSWLAFNILGLYPVAGSGEVLIGSPRVDKAVLALSDKLTISVVGRAEGKHIERVTLNGEELADRKTDMQTLKKGGNLVVEYR